MSVATVGIIKSLSRGPQREQGRIHDQMSVNLDQSFVHSPTVRMPILVSDHSEATRASISSGTWWPGL